MTNKLWSATNKLWSATLNSSAANYQTWRAILGQDEVPLKDPASHTAALGDTVTETCEVYVLDLDAFTELQIRRLVAFISQKYHVPSREVSETIPRDGFPIRAADVTVAYSMRAFL